MITNFIPDIGDRYYCATHSGAQSFTWDADSVDIDIARCTGVFPYTLEGEKLAILQHAFLKETSTFWEWVDDYAL